MIRVLLDESNTLRLGCDCVEERFHTTWYDPEPSGHSTAVCTDLGESRAVKIRRGTGTPCIPPFASSVHEGRNWWVTRGVCSFGERVE